MLNRCNECCYATLIETETYQYYKCEIMESIRNDRIRSGHVQIDGCTYFRPSSKKILGFALDDEANKPNRLETLIDK